MSTTPPEETKKAAETKSVKDMTPQQCRDVLRKHNAYLSDKNFDTADESLRAGNFENFFLLRPSRMNPHPALPKDEKFGFEGTHLAFSLTKSSFKDAEGNIKISQARYAMGPDGRIRRMSVINPKGPDGKFNREVEICTLQDETFENLNALLEKECKGYNAVVKLSVAERLLPNQQYAVATGGIAVVNAQTYITMNQKTNAEVQGQIAAAQHAPASKPPVQPAAKKVAPPVVASKPAAQTPAVKAAVPKSSLTAPIAQTAAPAAAPKPPAQATVAQPAAASKSPVQPAAGTVAARIAAIQKAPPAAPASRLAAQTPTARMAAVQTAAAQIATERTAAAATPEVQTQSKAVTTAFSSYAEMEENKKSKDFPLSLVEKGTEKEYPEKRPGIKYLVFKNNEEFAAATSAIEKYCSANGKQSKEFIRVAGGQPHTIEIKTPFQEELKNAREAIGVARPKM